MKEPIRDYVMRRSMPIPESGCWVWMGALNHNGYGAAFVAGARLAHRVSYIAFVGPIAPGFVVDHLCRVRSCVNPDHLRAVTSRENILAPGSESLSAANALKASCPKCGSEYSRRSRGWRRCRPCMNEENRKAWPAKWERIKARRNLDRAITIIKGTP